MNDLKQINKITTEVVKYVTNPYNDPMGLSYGFATMPDNIQEAIFEVCVSYIQDVANREEVFTEGMRINRDTARGMIG